MLKTISAAVLAMSMIAAPALAAESGNTAKMPAAGKTVQAPTKNTQVPADKTAQAPVNKTTSAKGSALNANAKMHRKHHRHYHHTSAARSHSKVSLKHAASTSRKG